MEQIADKQIQQVYEYLMAHGLEAQGCYYKRAMGWGSGEIRYNHYVQVKLDHPELLLLLTTRVKNFKYLDFTEVTWQLHLLSLVPEIDDRFYEGLSTSHMPLVAQCELKKLVTSIKQQYYTDERVG